jgi:hypothetical protein
MAGATTPFGRKGAVSATETYTIATAYVAPAASLGIDANELFRLARIIHEGNLASGIGRA